MYYKVNIKDAKTGIIAYSMYIPHRAKARRFRDKVNAILGKVASVQSKRVNMKYHHRALQRGYQKKGEPFDEFYRGKFGTGFIKHIPNNECSVSNNFHFIDYYIEC